MIRFTQAFTTLISTWLAPGLSALVTFTRYGACHTTPRSLPLIFTLARFFTSPRSRYRFSPFANQLASAWIVLVYVPAPEKYFTPVLELSVHEAKVFSVIEGGAPRSG